MIKFDTNGAGLGTIFYDPNDCDTLIKKTDETEINFYKGIYSNNVAEPIKQLKQILPEVIMKKTNAKTKILYMKNISKNMKEPLTLDLKIGTHCFSKEELKKHICFRLFRFLKKKIHNLISKYRGNERRGWNFNSGTGKQFSSITKISRLYKGRHSERYLELFIKNHQISCETLDRIIEKLQSIKSIIEKNGQFAFLDSSIFIAIDKENQHNLEVKLIDPSYYIDIKKESQKHFIKYSQRFNKGLECLLKYFQDLKLNILNQQNSKNLLINKGSDINLSNPNISEPKLPNQLLQKTPTCSLISSKKSLKQIQYCKRVKNEVLQCSL